MTSTGSTYNTPEDMVLSELPWAVARTPPGEFADPAPMASSAVTWQEKKNAGTVASLFPDIANQPGIEDSDWWFRCRFRPAHRGENHTAALIFNGLATVTEIWLNGEPLLSTDNMFRSYQVDVGTLLQQENILLICFRSETAWLEQRRPRPRWKTRLVAHQQLRWLRASLLGRIPGWTPPIPAVGPWRSIILHSIQPVEILSSRIGLDLTGNIQSFFRINVQDNIEFVTEASLLLGNRIIPLQVPPNAHGVTELHAETGCEGLALWWPHTHGIPALHDAVLVLVLDGVSLQFPLGRVGLKLLAPNPDPGKVGLRVNGIDVFSRGACWTSNDINSLSGDPAEMRQSLVLARDAGMNMLRIGGTMIYESDDFYRCCDELGIMVWQDFMFANMDYPVDDPDFLINVKAETSQQIARLAKHVCVSVYCGSSELQQQSAMLGNPQELWSNAFFDEVLPELCESLHPGIPYFPSTPCGGDLPIHTDQGLSHYYGIGAYKRSLAELPAANVKFTPETLGFSNVPENYLIDRIFSNGRPGLHDPRWKQGVPRDSGTGWDFEDIRDYYLEQLFQVDPVLLRSRDTDRYLALSRVVTGELLYRVFAYWRSPASGCSGGLVWFFRDLVPGAGWGVIDCNNVPKAVYYFLKRVFIPTGVFIEDRGLNGLALHMLNESDHIINAELQLLAWGDSQRETVSASRQVTLAANQAVTINADELTGHFTDLSYSYQFGALQHHIVAARLLNSDTGTLLNEDCFLPMNMVRPMQRDVSVELSCTPVVDGRCQLTLTSPRFLQSVNLRLKNHAPGDNYFHLLPGVPKNIMLVQAEMSDKSGPAGYLDAVNLTEQIRIKV